MPKHKPNLSEAARENPTYATLQTTSGPRRFDVTTRDGHNTVLYKDVLHANATWGEVNRILSELGLQAEPSGGWVCLTGRLRARVIPADS